MVFADIFFNVWEQSHDYEIVADLQRPGKHDVTIASSAWKSKEDITELSGAVSEVFIY